MRKGGNIVKKFIIRSFVVFSIIFMFFFMLTMGLEWKNKDKLKEQVKIETTIKDNQIVLPETPGKVAANLQFSEYYYFCGLAISIALPILFVYCNGIAVIKKKKNKFTLIEGAKIFLLYSLFEITMSFPKSFFSGFYRRRLVGLSVQTLGDFFVEFISSNFVDILITLPIAMIIYLIYRKVKSWYFLAPAVIIAVSLIGNYVYPYIDELTNNLWVMEEGELRDGIEEIAKKSGIDNLDIRVVEKSNETNSMNAYMTGIGKSKRIVFWDTTLKGLSKEEILSVAAHEIGHYKLNHIPKGMLVECLLIILAFLAMHNVVRRVKGENYRTIDNLPFIILCINIIMLIATPIETAYSRKHETEADTYAIEITKDPLTNGILELRFIESNLTPIEVKGLYKWLVYDHPSVKERIDLSNRMAEEMK